MSLVPSTTETLLAWDVTPVACTRFCEQPELAQVGGTKNPDLEAIAALAPDLVVMCDEENRIEDAEALTASGIDVHSCSPRSVDGVGPALKALSARVGVSPDPLLTGVVTAATEPLALRAFVPIWRRPWMSLAGDTYGSSVLTGLGVINVFADATDRYPEVDLADLAELDVEVILAPSEPYAFRPGHLTELAEVAPVVEVDGQDLFWWGVRTPAALRRLHERIQAVSNR